MSTAEAARPSTIDAPSQQDSSLTIQWNESAAVAARRLRHGTIASLTVMADGRALGQIRLADIERCELNGNWLDAVMVHDLIHRTSDTCN